MKRFVEGDRSQSTLFPVRLDDYICDDNPVRVVEAFVQELDLGTLGFDGIEPEVGFATTSADCRTPLRNAQSLDGSDALLDQDAPAREY
jgi:hypothetical protein